MSTTVRGEKTDNVRATDLHAVYRCTGSDMATGHHRGVAEHLMKSHAHPLATWEGSVLPALRLALDEHPETRGAMFVRVETDDPRAFEVTVLTSVGRQSGEIPRDSAEMVVEYSEWLAFRAAKMVREAKARAAAKPDCPVCQAIAGWAPACTQCRSGGSVTYDPAKVRASIDGHALVPMSAEDETAAWGGRTPLPQGWEWGNGVSCRAQTAGMERWVLVETKGPLQGLVFFKDDKPCPADVLAALRIEARRLGIPLVEPSPTFVLRPDGAPPAPAGYRFAWRGGDHLRVEQVQLRRRGGAKERARIDTLRGLAEQVTPTGDYSCSSLISWGNQAPGWLADDEHREAWNHARRLLAERKQAPPPGYTFKFDCDGDVEVERTDGRTMCVDDDDDELEMLVYARAAGRSIDVSDNAAPDLWADHEPARQWAALLLGEVAPPLRGSEPAAPQIGVGSRVVLHGSEGEGWVSDMAEFEGMVAKVTAVHHNGGVNVDIDDGAWWWDTAALRLA